MKKVILVITAVFLLFGMTLTGNAYAMAYGKINVAGIQNACGKKQSSTMQNTESTKQSSMIQNACGKKKSPNMQNAKSKKKSSMMQNACGKQIK